MEKEHQRSIQRSTSTKSSIALLPDKSLSSIFWKAYKEDFRVFKLFNKSKKDNMLANYKRMNPNSKIKLETIIQGVVNEANEANSQKYDLDMDRALEWSLENKKIEELIFKRGYDRDTTINRFFIRKFYTELKFCDRGILTIDKKFSEFDNLKHLNLDSNQIKQLSHLPLSIRELIVSRNCVESVARHCFLPNLMFLKLSHNNITQKSLEAFPGLFPQLMSLDLSFNNITNLSICVSHLRGLKKLKMLSLKGNPIQLLRFYEEYVKSELNGLQYLDMKKLKKEEDSAGRYVIRDYTSLLKQQYGEDYEQKLQEQQEEANKVGKKKPGKRDQKKKRVPSGKASRLKSGSGAGRGALANQVDQMKANILPTEGDGEMGSIHNNSALNLDKSLVFDTEKQAKFHSEDFVHFVDFGIEVKTFENFKSVFIEELAVEPSEGEGGEEIKPDYDRFMSSYWIEYTFFGNSVNTKEEKVLQSGCMKIPDHPQGLSVLNFDSGLKLNLPISNELIAEFYRNLVIKVYTKYPELKKVEEGEEKPETPEVTIKEHMLGFCIIDLTEFVFNNELKVLEKKYNLFEYEDEGLFKNSELHWPLPDERTILRKSAEEVTKLKEEKYQPVKEEVEEPVNTRGKPKRGQAKASRKKIQKNVKKKVEVAEAKVDMVDWRVDEREALAYKNDFLGKVELARNPKNHFLVAHDKRLAVKITLES